MTGDQLHRELAVRMSLRAVGVRPAQKDEFEKVLELFDSPATAKRTKEETRKRLERRGVTAVTR